MEKNMTLFVPTYHIELLSDNIPLFDVKAIHAALNETCGKTRLEANTSDFLVFAFEDYALEGKDKKDSPQCVIIKKDHSLDYSNINASMDQTWDWHEKEEVVKKCTHRVIFSDFLADQLEWRNRINLFNKALCAILKNTRFLAMNWINSLKLVSPKDYLAALDLVEAQDYLYGALNVRLFIIDPTSNDILMDTMGLSAFGLPDLQCRFKDMAPEDVAGVLFNYGYYIFEKGDVISDNHTIQGVNAEQKWKCIHKPSMFGPKRTVIDCEPNG